jgi:hypothetical protein
MNGDLLELLFVAAFILFGLLGGRKKKRVPTPTPRSRPRPDLRSAADRTAVRQPPTAHAPAGAAPRGRSDQERLLRELEGLLTGRPVRPEPEPAPAPGSMEDFPEPEEARSLESLAPEEPSPWEEAKARVPDVTDRWRAGRERPAETLETLEEAGGASHDRFHALYDRPPDVAQPTGTPPAFPTSDIRRAVIWSEILGPPVSQR